MGPQMLPPVGPGERPPEALPPLNPVGSEFASPGASQKSPEMVPSFEAQEQKTGAGVGDGDGSGAVMPISVAPPAALPDASSAAIPTPNDPSSLAADDVDLIEKEWVIKSKEIQKKFRDDPHQQRSSVSALNADYLIKRFGVQVKLPQE